MKEEKKEKIKITLDGEKIVSWKRKERKIKTLDRGDEKREKRMKKNRWKK